MTDEDRAEIRRIVAEELKNFAPKKGLTIRRVGVPLDIEALKNAVGALEELQRAGISLPAAADQCCNGCD